MGQRRLLITLLTIALALVMLAMPALAQGEPPAQLNTALADLSARLGQVITPRTIERYQFTQILFGDSTLGCEFVEPIEGIRPGSIAGYQFLITYRGQTFDYRVAADNSIVFPCDEELLALEPAIELGYIADPCPPDFRFFLQPRLRVGGQARVIGSEGNRLRTAPSLEADQIIVINPNAIVDVIGGPSCSQGGIVWWQIAAFGQVGWTAEGVLPDTYFLEPVTRVATQTPTPPPVSAETSAAEPAFAAVSGDQIVIYDYAPGRGLSRLAAVNQALNPFALQVGVPMAWSPDGSFLAYIVREAGGTTADLYAIFSPASADTPPVLLAADVYADFGVSFTPEGDVLYAQPRANAAPLATTDLPPGGGALLLDVYAQSPLGQISPRPVAEVPFGVGCGGMALPDAQQFYAEAGVNGRAPRLALTRFGLLYTTNCTGSGTALVDPVSGDWRPVGTNLSRFSISPDGTRIIGLADPEPGFGDGVLTIVDLASGAETTLVTAAQPDQVAWGPSGEIYYSTRTPAGVVPGSAALTTGELTAYSVSVHRIDLEAATDAEIWSGRAFAVGRLLPAPGGVLYFTTTPNADAWVAAAASGALGEEELYSLRAYDFLPVSLYRLPRGRTAELLSTEVARVALNAAALE